MKEWHFNVLFWVGVGSAILILIGPDIGLKVGENPGALTGVGAILTYILTQRYRIRSDEKEEDPDKPHKRKTDKHGGGS